MSTARINERSRRPPRGLLLFSTRATLVSYQKAGRAVAFAKADRARNSLAKAGDAMLMSRFIFVALIGLAASVLPAARSILHGQSDRVYLLERVDDAAVVQLYADGFEELPLKDKILIWHLSEAAIAGRDIFFDQKHRDALAMRAVVEAIVRQPKGVDPSV